jgi:hypothetical protein
VQRRLAAGSPASCFGAALRLWRVLAAMLCACDVTANVHICADMHHIWWHHRLSWQCAHSLIFSPQRVQKVL